MKSRWLFKNGISPLIATVLLISFVVTFGVLIVTWSRTPPTGFVIYDTDNILNDESYACKNVKIEILRPENNKICYKKIGQVTKLNFDLSNTGSVKISGINLWVIGYNASNSFNLDSLSIDAGEIISIRDLSIPYIFNNNGKISHVWLIPKIRIEKRTEICPLNSIDVKMVNECF